MGRPSKQRIARNKNVQRARKNNIKMPRQLRGVSKRREKIRKLVKRNHQNAQFNQLEHLKKTRHARTIKTKTRRRHRKARQNAASVARFRKQVVNLPDSQTNDRLLSASPEMVFALKRNARISDHGFSKVNKFLKASFDHTLSSTRKLRETRNHLQSIVKYDIHDNFDVRIMNLEQ